MIYCLNPTCQNPQNPDEVKFCRSCGAELASLLRGRYRVIQTIGQGGFGRTYLAVDEDRLKTRCVIKQFSPNFQGTKSLDKALELFDQEAIRLHELGEHPQIPTLLAYFEHDKRLYLVQQFIEGQNLAQELQRQGAFSEQKIRELLTGILPVLKFIHEHQVVHRDITPTNIMRRQNDGRLMLIDFGVSKQLTGANPLLSGTRIGTEGFSPMEQLRSGKAYPASDLYSLGAVCLYLLTQTNPEDLYDPLSGQWIWREHLARKGTTISDRLGQILDKLLKDLVNERYQAADHVLKDLHSGSSTPVTAPPQVFGSAGPIPPAPAVSKPQSSSPRPSQPISSHPARAKPLSQPQSSNPPASKPQAALASTFRPLVSQPATARYWSCVHTFTGHPSWVTCVTLSPDQKILASGSLDDTIKIWSLQTGELMQTLRGHSRGINCLAISPNSQTLISGSDDDSLKIWSLLTGEVLGTLTDHSRDINSVAISADGRIFASGSEDRTIRLWDLFSGELLRTFYGPASMIKAVAITPNAQCIASGGLDNKIKLWNLNTGELMRTLTGHLNSVTALAIDPNGEWIASASKDKTIKLWNLKTGDLLRTLTGHTDLVNTVVISPTGKTVVSGSSDKTIKLWDFQTGELLHTLVEHLDSVNSLAISADGLALVSGSKDKTIKIWQGSA